MSVVMLLPALALATVTGLNVYLSIILMGTVTTVYAMEGGFEAVVWTDVLQVGVMLGGVGTAIWFMAHGVPGGLGGNY
jgi:Na+/proline symporter